MLTFSLFGLMWRYFDEQESDVEINWKLRFWAFQRAIKRAVSGWLRRARGLPRIGLTGLRELSGQKGPE